MSDNNEMKSEMLRMVETYCPKAKDDQLIMTSAVNRMCEFIHDLNAAIDHAEAFIENPHHGVMGNLIETWDQERKAWVPYELADAIDVSGAFKEFCFEGFDYAYGLYENWGMECFGDCVSADWNDRLGVKDEPPIDVREEVYGKSDIIGWYRLRLVPVGPFSEKAKEWMRDNISYFNYVCKIRLGEV